MQKSKTAPTVHGSLPGVKGRYVGLEAVAKGLYRVVLLETLDGQVVRRTVVSRDREDSTPDGRRVVGSGLAVSMSNLNAAIGKHLRDVSDLWQR